LWSGRNGYSPTVDALIHTLKTSAAALERARIPHLVGGGIACWARGGPLVTNDLDLMVRPDDAERTLVALVDAGLRGERPPEQWLLKAWDGDVLVDVIFEPSGLVMSDEVIARGDRLNVAGMWMNVMALEDVLTTKLAALEEHSLDYEKLVQIARSLREQVDWSTLRARADGSPFVRAYFALLEDLDIIAPVHERESARPRVRVA
jgi:hypothetical protein